MEATNINTAPKSSPQQMREQVATIPALECPTCNTIAPSTIYARASDYLTNDDFAVRQCSHCGLAWTSPRPVNLERYYPAVYRRYNRLVLIIINLLYSLRVARWSALFPRPGAALELGCGDGYMLAALKRHGWAVSGTERTTEMARFARENFGIRVFVEENEQIPATERFDLVIMFQVLEHLSDPGAALSRCAQFLAPGGRIIVGVPNFSSWQSRFARENWFHLDVPRHLLHLSPASLSFAAAQCGLKVQRISYLSPEHDPYGWVQSILNKFFGNGNRLTALLMRATKPRPSDVVLVAMAGVLGIISLPLALISWCCGQGAIMEVVLERSESSSAPA